MSHYPPPCNACGAPMVGGRCPRCRAEARPLGGKVVYSGSGVLGGVSAGPPLTMRGFVNGSGDSAQLNDVVADPNDLLCVYTVLFSDGSIVGTPAPTWRGLPVADSGFVDGFFDGSREVLCYLATLPITSLNAGSGTVVSDLVEPGMQAVALYAWTIAGVSTYSASGDDSHPAPAAGPISASIIVPAAGSLVVLYTYQQNEVVDGGAYTAGATAIRSDSLTGGSNVGRASIATFSAPTVGTYSPGRALANPPKAYFGHAMSFSP